MLFKIFIAHGAIRRTEIDRLRQDLFLPSPGADGLIVEPHGGIDLCIFIEPLRVNRIREGRTRAVDHHLRRGRSQ